MTHKVVVDPRARFDLVQIHAYIAQDSPANAQKFITDLESAIASLTHMPARARIRDDLRPGYRAITVGSHLIFFRIVGDEVQVARVIHGARDIPNAFDDDQQ